MYTMFKRKDFVQVVMANNACFDFQTGPSFDARIEYVPCGPGDMWQFAALGVSSTDAHTPIIKYIAINPSAADFIGLVRTEDMS